MLKSSRRPCLLSAAVALLVCWPAISAAHTVAYVPLVECGDVVALDQAGSTVARLSLCTRNDDLHCALTGIAIGDGGTRAYIASVSALYVIDTTTNRLLDRIPLSGNAIAGFPDGRRVLVAACGTDSPFGGTGPLCEVDLTTGRVTRMIDFDGGSRDVVVSGDGRTAIVVVGSDASSTGRVVLLDTDTFRVLHSIEFDGPVRSVLFAPDGRRAYALVPGRLAVLQVASGIWSSTIDLGGSDGLRMSIAPTGQRIYLTSFDALRDAVLLVEVEREALIGEIDVSFGLSGGGRPFGIAASPDGERLYVALSEDYAVSVINVRNGEEVARTSQLGEAPYYVAVADVPDDAVSDSGCRAGGDEGRWPWASLVVAVVCLSARSRERWRSTAPLVRIHVTGSRTLRGSGART